MCTVGTWMVALRRAIRRILRRRAFLLSLAILPQVVVLGVLAGLFWMVRVKEVVIAPALVVKTPEGEFLRCRLPPGDAEKIPPGTSALVEVLGSADDVQALGRGLTGTARAEKGDILVDIRGRGLGEVMRKAELSRSPRVRITVRSRRALSVILHSRGSASVDETTTGGS